MANLKEVRDRIKSVISTQQITKAMKMVSAAKLRRAQDAIVRMRPYAQRLNDMMLNVMSNLDGDTSISYGISRPVQKALIVVVTSNRGLCGAFNSNICKIAVRTANEQFAEQLEKGDVEFMCIGRKAYDFFRKRYDPKQVNNEHVNLFDDLSFDAISHVPDEIMQAFNDLTYDAVVVCFGQFKNAAMQSAEAIPFLPVPKLPAKKGEETKKADYIFEPDKEKLLSELIPSILQTQFHRALLDTNASEHGARMTAMDKATENADDLLKDLRITYNKARQEEITSQISEIVGGAAALEG